jgi:hypothetical protein
MLRFYNIGGGDTGLVMVNIHGAPSGQYDVWVTSYQSGESIRGTLYVSELASQGTKKGGK